MNELTTYTNELLGNVRTISIDREPWFALIDVCSTLDLSNSRMVADRLDDDEVRKFNLHGLEGETWFVNEAGLYHVILTSRSEKAKPFRRWVTHEVLPAIRKEGFYSTLTPQRLIEVMKDKLSKDEHYLDDVQLAKVKAAVKADKRTAGVKLTEELWLNHFQEYDRPTFVAALKQIWCKDYPDVQMFHKYRNKYDVDERKKAKGGIVTFP